MIALNSDEDDMKNKVKNYITAKRQQSPHLNPLEIGGKILKQ